MRRPLGQAKITSVPPGLEGTQVVEEGEVVPFVGTYDGPKTSGIVIEPATTTFRAPEGTYDVEEVNADVAAEVNDE